MSFNDNIFSREQGTSAELYIFSFSNGTSLYFTSFERDLLTTETWDGNAYTHIPIQRGEYENDDALSASKIQITSPTLNTFVNSLISGGQIMVTITKLFLSDKTYQSIFNGLILSIEKNIGEAIAQCASKMYYLEKELPRVFFQAPCNNTLFDSKCGLFSDDYKYTISVVISENGYKLTMTTGDYNDLESAFYSDHLVTPPAGGFGSKVKGMWTLGRAKYQGEIRYITKSNTGIFYLHYPFIGITSGTISIDIFPGCDKTAAYCSAFFGSAPYPPGNIINFTGFPYMPAMDPTIMAVGK
jgi:hypothetical protein